MDYLNTNEKKQLAYSSRYAFPSRPQTDIEKQISRVIMVQGIPATTKEEIANKQRELDFSLDQLTELTASSRLTAKVRAALANPEKFEEFTDGYPYAKYIDYINDTRPMSTLVLLARDGFSEESIRNLMRWVSMLCLTFHDDLPKGIDTFIWTHHTRHYKTHSMAKATGEKAFYGYALPASVQAHVGTLFGKDGSVGGSLWAMHHVRRTELHKSRETWERLGWSDIAKEVFDKGLEINFGHDSVYLGPFSSEPYWFLELKQESTNTRLRFIIEG